MTQNFCKITEAVSFYILARKYDDAARNLYKQRARHEYVNEPAFALIAHSLELNMKAMGMLVEPCFDPQKYKHDLTKLFNHLKQYTWSHQVLENAEVFANKKIREITTHLRDKGLNKVLAYLGKSELTVELMNQNGFYSDEQIATLNFDLSEIVEWFSDQVKAGGSQFRYPKSRILSLNTISGGTTDKDEVIEFLLPYWANVYMHGECVKKARFEFQ